MAPRKATLLAALAMAALAAQAADAAQAPPVSLSDIGTGTPAAVDCPEEPPLEGNWLEITQARFPRQGTPRLGVTPVMAEGSSRARALFNRAPAGRPALCRSGRRRPAPSPRLVQILNYTQYTSTPVSCGKPCAEALQQKRRGRCGPPDASAARARAHGLPPCPARGRAGLGCLGHARPRPFPLLHDVEEHQGPWILLRVSVPGGRAPRPDEARHGAALAPSQAELPAASAAPLARCFSRSPSAPADCQGDACNVYLEE